MSLITIATTMMTIGVMLCFTTVALATPISTRQQQQAENLANLAERMSDRQHVKYCERFGETFNTQPDAWAKVHKECIVKMVYDRENMKLPANFPKVDAEMSGKVKQIGDKCGNLVKNPCNEDDWTVVKKCIREEGIRVDLLNAGKPGGVVPKNMASMSLGLASSIFECTDNVLKTEPSTRR